MRKKVIREVLLIFVLALISGIVYNALSSVGIPLFYSAIETAPDQRLNREQVEAVIADRRALLIDARSPEEYTTGYLPGAINVPGYAPVDQIMEALKDIPKDKTIVAYCSGITCPFADRLAGFLRFQEYSSVFVFPGGVEEWEAGGNPLIR